MPPDERRLQRARQNPRNVKFEELRRLYEDHGFTVQSGKGSHYVARLHGTNIKEIFPRPTRGPMKRPYVIKALNAIDLAQALGVIGKD